MQSKGVIKKKNMKNDLKHARKLVVLYKVYTIYKGV